MKKFINEFREFALQGNVFDLAIGVIIGGAFTAIVNSLVTDIITPIISLIANTSNLETLEYVMRDAVLSPDGEVIKEAVVFRYGSFLDSVISFLIIAFIIFLMVRALNRFKRNEAVVEEAPTPSDEVVLLEKIYETLQENKDIRK